MDKIIIPFLLVLLLITGCRETQRSQSDKKTNPTAREFNTEASDARAIAIADRVMKAIGGRESWRETSVISWNFLGRRTHTWNKKTGRDSIHISASDMVIDLNIQSLDGSVIKEGEEVSHPDTLDKYLQQGYEMWVNDSYWLFMPFKLKDSGVTLNYMGLDSTQSGIPSHKLKLTFDNVGVTPQNMYHVYVDTTDFLIKQWAYFPDSASENPSFVLPWKNYEKHGDILLSGDRGQYTLSDIKVMEQWPRN